MAAVESELYPSLTSLRLYEGSIFESLDDLRDTIEKYSEANDCLFVKGDSRRLKSYNGYDYITFVCKHGGKIRPSKSRGIRPNQTSIKFDCPVRIRATSKISEDGIAYKVSKLHLHHNHNRFGKMTATLNFNLNITKDLISAFQAHPCLWDNASSDYYNKTARSLALTDLCKAMGFDVDERSIRLVKSKIKLMRSNFARELRKMKRFINEGPNTVFVSKWRWFEDLRFLEPGSHVVLKTEPSVFETILKAESVSRMGSEDMDIQSLSCYQTSQNDMVISLRPSAEHAYSSTPNSTSESASSQNNGFENPNSQNSLLENRNSRSNSSEHPSSHNNLLGNSASQDNLSECSQDRIPSNSKHFHFAMFVAEELNGMSPDQAKSARRAIQQVLLKYSN